MKNKQGNSLLSDLGINDGVDVIDIKISLRKGAKSTGASIARQVKNVTGAKKDGRTQIYTDF